MVRLPLKWPISFAVAGHATSERDSELVQRASALPCAAHVERRLIFLVTKIVIYTAGLYDVLEVALHISC